MVYDTDLAHVGIGNIIIKIDRRSRHLYRLAGRQPYLATLIHPSLGQVKNGLNMPPGHLDKLRFSLVGRIADWYFSPWDSF